MRQQRGVVVQTSCVLLSFCLAAVVMVQARNVTLWTTRSEIIASPSPGSLHIPWARDATPPTPTASSSGMTTTASLNRTQLQQVRRNIIRGSNSTVTITKMNYLKKEMCKSAPLQQAVRERGCVRRLIVNRFCYGQCNSFFIPKTVSRDDRDGASLEETAFKSCSFCRPKAVRWVRVLLQCPRITASPTKRKRVQIVMQCSCTALALN